MLPPKLVTVIIPSYNRAHFLPQAIKSVQNQTYPHIQIIVVDDGSTDNTAEIVAEFEGVEYYYQSNQRQGAARNLGLSKAKGEFIASLDADDAWHKSFIAESVSCLEAKDLDFVFSNWIYHTDSLDFSSKWYSSRIWKKYRENPYKSWFLLNPDSVRALFIETCPAPSSSLVIKKDSLVKNWNEEMLIADDWCLILDMVLNKKCRAGFTLKPLWVKSIHDQNIYDGQEEIETSKKLGLHDEEILFQRFESQLTQVEKMIFQKRNAEHHFNIGFWGLRKSGFSRKSLKYLFKSFFIHPTGVLEIIFKRLAMRWQNLFPKNQLPILEMSQLPNND